MRPSCSASPLMLLCFVSLVPLVALGAGCGSSQPAPAKTPESAPVETAAPTATDASAPSASTPATAATDASAAAPSSTAAASGDPNTTYVPGTDAPKRLEDMKIVKTTSAGGHYGLMVQSASGVASEDVGRALGDSVSKTDACYAKLFGKQGAAKGKTSFDVTISLKGTTETVKLRTDEVRNKDLVKCLEGVIKTVDWPVPNDIHGSKTTFSWVVEGN